MLSLMSEPPRWCTEWTLIWPGREAASPWPRHCRRPLGRTVNYFYFLSISKDYKRIRVLHSDSAAYGCLGRWSSLPEREDWHQELHPRHEAAWSLRLWTGPVVDMDFCDFYFLMTFMFKFYNKEFNGRMNLLMELLNLDRNKYQLCKCIYIDLLYVRKNSPVIKWMFWKIKHCQSCFRCDYDLNTIIVSFLHEDFRKLATILSLRRNY